MNYKVIQKKTFNGIMRKVIGKSTKLRQTLVSLMLFIGVFIFLNYKNSAQAKTNRNDSNPMTVEIDSVPQKRFQATWIAVGDIMMHYPQLPSYYNATDSTYNFMPYFEAVKPIIETGDWALANLETPISDRSIKYSGYPNFNAPKELATALKYAGFNIITNANNHALDQGEKGITASLESLSEEGLIFKGTARSQDEANRLTIVERNGIKMGLLAYTYGTNGIPMPKNKPYSVSLSKEDTIIAAIKRLREAGTDFITVSLHFGMEYQTSPNSDQKKLARKLIASGADIIAGSHPHVIQPYEKVNVMRDTKIVRQGLIIYSMGNFISNQRSDTKEYGVIFKVAIHKDPNRGTTTLGTIEPIPTWVYRGGHPGAYTYRVLPLEQTIKNQNIEFLTKKEYDTLSTRYTELLNRLETMAKEPFNIQENQK